MNYIILNGIGSGDIEGLLIQSLAPITKPAQRVNVEEIDGRDGDITTLLGYSSYDKEVSIGLYGNYNVDDVIAYFVNNMEGQVTFSNEPELYYNYEIVEQIDFERLIRFKTAKVKFHIQPFKYSNEELLKKNAITTQTSVTITNNGNYISKPVLKITGTGTINLSLNNYQVFVISLPSTSTIIYTDTALLEAYNGETLMNRLVNGDYSNFALNVGKNTISWTGTITEIDIKNYSRWI